MLSTLTCGSKEHELEASILGTVEEYDLLHG